LQRNYYEVDGTIIAGRSHAIILAYSEILDAARGVSSLRPGFFAAVADHETNRALNEVDLELDDDARGFVSRGPFQQSDGWGRRPADSILNLTTGNDTYTQSDDETRGCGNFDGLTNRPKLTTSLQDATQAFSLRMEPQFAGIISAAHIFLTSHDLPSPPTPIQDDWYAYLALAHNEGLNAAKKTIGIHGADWPAYKARNGACSAHAAPLAMSYGKGFDCLTCTPYIRRIGAYGDDCMVPDYGT
jgi:hypothetical protein